MPAYVDALLLDIKGDHQGAIEGFRQVMSLLPGEPAVRFAVSRAYLQLAVLDSARVYGEAAVKLDPNNSHYLRYLAGLTHELRDYRSSADLYGRAYALEPDKPALLYRQGLELISANRPLQAIAVFEQALKADPYNETVLSALLTLQIRIKCYPDAIESCNKLLQLDPGNPKFRMMLGKLYAKNGHPKLAAATLKELIESDPSYLPGWTALFDFYISTGRPTDFRRDLHALIDSGAAESEQLDDLVRFFIGRSGKIEQYGAPSRELLDELLAKYPRDSNLFVLKGLFEIIHDRQREGRLLFRKAIELDSGNADAWEYLITTYISGNEMPQASDLLRHSREALPEELLRWKLLESSMLLRAGSPKDAATVLEEAVTIRAEKGDMPRLIRAYLNLALAYDMLGMKKNSRLAYAMLLRLDPHNSIAMNNLAYMLAEEGVNLRKAWRLAVNAVMLDPENGVYLDTLGWVNFKLGNYDRARLILEKVVDIGFIEADIYEHLGEVYRRLGKKAKAREMFERAKKVEAEAGK